MLTPTRHDDLDELRQKKLAIPAVFRHGAWLTLPLGAGGDGAPGPRGTQLLLWLPVAADAAAPGAAAAPSWAEVDAAIGARGADSSRTLPLAAAALWEDAPGGGPEVAAADHYIVHGAEYPAGAAAFGNIFWKHGWVLGTRAGLLVSLISS